MARRPTQRQLFAELAAKFGPEVAEAFMVVVADLKSGVEFQRLVAAIDRLSLERKAAPTLAIWRDALEELAGASQPRLL